jgi:hypothetical protein
VPETTITGIREKHARDVLPEDAQIFDFSLQLVRKNVDDAIFKAVQARYTKPRLAPFNSYGQDGVRRRRRQTAGCRQYAGTSAWLRAA